MLSCAAAPMSSALSASSHPTHFLDVLAEGGGAPDFLGRSAQKVVLVRRAAAAKVA